jgi:uncharacterized protein YkwD
MPIKLGCPNCHSVMKVSSKVPRGTPVKCPSCSLVFPNPGRNGRHHSSRHSSSSGGGYSTRPAKSSLGLKIKRVLLVFLFLIVVGVGGVGAYFLATKFGIGSSSGTTDGQAKGTQPAGPAGPGTATNENPVNKGSGKEDPLAFVPPDANVLIGMNGPGMLGDKHLKTILEQNLGQLGLVKTIAGDCKKETGLELKDLFDTTIIALKMSGDKPESVTLIVKSGTPFDQKKLAQWATDKPAQKVKDKFYYDKHKDITSAATVYMPSDRVLVISDIPAGKWEALFTTDGSKPTPAADTLAVVRKAEKGPFWIVLPLDAKAKEGRAAELAALLPAGVQGAYKKALGDAKTAAFAAQPEGGKIKISALLACGNDGAANELIGALQGGWAKVKDALVKGVGNAGLPKDLAGTLQLSRDANVAVATAVFGPEALDPLVKGGLGTVYKSAQDAATQLVKALPEDKPAEKPFALSPEEKRLFDIVNAYRTGKGKKALKENPKLFEIARTYATLMAKEGKLDDELDEKDTPKRVKAGGYKISEDLVTANISGGANYSPDTALQQWTQSAAANENLLEKYEETGIGVGKKENEVFFYMIYAVPEK